MEVRRSARRRRTVSAYERDGRMIVMVPDRFTAAEEAQWVEKMVERLMAKRDRRRVGQSDEGLLQRAEELSQRWLEGRARPASVRWVTNQNTRWGSCTPADATIRLSHRMQQMPDWVVDYVLVHELAHLLESGHGAAFKRWEQRYPLATKAQGFLEGWTAAGGA